MRTRFLACLLLVFFSFAQASSWELKKDEDGIRVYVRDIKGSEFRAFRGTVEVSSSLGAIVAVLKDGDGTRQWLKDCEDSKFLSEFDPAGYLMYFRTDAPWPVKDRDYALRYKLEQDPQTLSVTLSFKGDASLTPQRDECVRVSDIEGAWHMTPQPSGKILLEYEVSADPNGSLPAWLANQFVVDQPFYTLKKFRKQIQLPQYRDQRFDFIREPTGSASTDAR